MTPQKMLRISSLISTRRGVHLRAANAAKSNIDQKEIEHFTSHAEEWWSPNSPMAPLKAMNALRVPFVQNGLVNTKRLNTEVAAGPKPLKGIKILDVGCGGGYFSVPLARLGADVTGIDPTPAVIKVAQLYSAKHVPNVKLKFVETTIEDHAVSNSEQYDVVVSSEVIEHVINKESFVNASVVAVKVCPTSYACCTNI